MDNKKRRMGAMNPLANAFGQQPMNSQAAGANPMGGMQQPGGPGGMGSGMPGMGMGGMGM